MDKQELVEMLRRRVGDTESLARTTGLLLRCVEDLNLAYESRIGYFINLASSLFEMGSEALVAACNLLVDDVPINDSTIIKSWTAEELS